MTQVIDAGDLRKYRTEIPNLIDDMDLSVHAFRLYVHLKRVAGDSGKCWQGKRTMAESCKMSAGTVTKAKRELVDAGLIEVEPGNAIAGQPDTITICDVWGQNFVRYSSSDPGHTVNGGGHTVTSPGHTVNGGGHVVNGGGHVVNGGGHVVNAKKEPMKKEPMKKEPKTTTEAPGATEERAALTTDGRRRRHADIDTDFGEICRKYEQEFGFLSPVAADTLSEMLDEYKSKRLVLEAFDLAVMANKRSLRYVEGILRNWRAEGKNGKSSAATGTPATTKTDPQSIVSDELMAWMEKRAHEEFMARRRS